MIGLQSPHAILLSSFQGRYEAIGMLKSAIPQRIEEGENVIYHALQPDVVSGFYFEGSPSGDFLKQATGSGMINIQNGYCQPIMSNLEPSLNSWGDYEERKKLFNEFVKKSDIPPEEKEEAKKISNTQNAVAYFEKVRLVRSVCKDNKEKIYESHRNLKMNEIVKGGNEEDACVFVWSQCSPSLESGTIFANINIGYVVSETDFNFLKDVIRDRPTEVRELIVESLPEHKFNSEKRGQETDWRELLTHFDSKECKDKEMCLATNHEDFFRYPYPRGVFIVSREDYSLEFASL